MSQQSETWNIRCACGVTEAGTNDAEAWIGCDECGVWQHNICMGISIYTEDIPKRYMCEKCAPEKHQPLLSAISRGETLWVKRRQKHQKMSEDGKKQARADEKSKKRKRVPEAQSVSYNLPLTENCHHYTRRKDVDWDIQKYWDQRYSIFERYDEGIMMTDDAWFGVTPEPIATRVANDFQSVVDSSKNVLIDMFAGAGGNCIAFALSGRWSRIIAIEKDSSVLSCAQNNAAIYGVSEHITWVNDDCFSYLSSNRSSIDPSNTVVFASPPWGGPGYNDDKVFNLKTMQPYSINQIHDACKHMDSALFLPRTSDLRQIARLAPEAKKIEVVQYCMEGASKALVAYIPATRLAAS